MLKFYSTCSLSTIKLTLLFLIPPFSFLFHTELLKRTFMAAATIRRLL